MLKIVTEWRNCAQNEDKRHNYEAVIKNNPVGEELERRNMATFIFSTVFDHHLLLRVILVIPRFIAIKCSYARANACALSERGLYKYGLRFVSPFQSIRYEIIFLRRGVFVPSLCRRTAHQLLFRPRTNIRRSGFEQWSFSNLFRCR